MKTRHSPPSHRVCAICGFREDFHTATYSGAAFDGTGWKWYLDVSLCPEHARTDRGREMISERRQLALDPEVTKDV